MHARPHRRKGQLPPRSLRDLRSRGAGTFRHQPFGRQKFLPISATIVAQISRQICSHTPSALNAGAKRSDVPYGHASMLLLGEGSEATKPYNKYANLFKYISYLISLINPFGRHSCRPCDRRHIVAQMAGDEMSLTRSR